ncbi:MAG: leucyl/phenylalanyl-tRNA--protein transferase [Pseudomonadota bacterium]|nr:leucyl/phenylalanyl-tRNA--protein transferase [Pseudomonadota bacterium]
MTLTNQSYGFPDVEEATTEGLLAIGGDLSSERLLTAYRRGIFPWYNHGQPILWWSPNPRTVLYPKGLHVSRSLRKTLRNKKFRTTMDTAFDRVVSGCMKMTRNETETGTWITKDMKAAYIRLYQLGYAHSVEVWHDDQLVGGLYGVAIGKVFFGESMFSQMRDASKVALKALVSKLLLWDFDFIDCQLPSNHLFSLGAENLPRARFVDELKRGIQRPSHPGSWS